jgi:hypothetical protein
VPYSYTRSFVVLVGATTGGLPATPDVAPGLAAIQIEVVNSQGLGLPSKHLDRRQTHLLL